jgi:hypothetical protein
VLPLESRGGIKQGPLLCLKKKRVAYASKNKNKNKNKKGPKGDREIISSTGANKKNLFFFIRRRQRLNKEP